MYVLDFDYTIFDTDQMRQRLINAVSGNVTEAEYRAGEAELKARTEPYSLTNHTQVLGQLAAREQLEQAFASAMVDLRDCVYADAWDFLHRHDATELALLTFGDQTFQQQKIDGAHIHQLFSQIAITSDDKVAALRELRLPDNTTIINDRGGEIDAMAEAFPQYTYVRIARPDTPYVNEPCTAPHTTIEHLNDL